MKFKAKCGDSYFIGFDAGRAIWSTGEDRARVLDTSETLVIDVIENQFKIERLPIELKP